MSVAVREGQASADVTDSRAREWARSMAAKWPTLAVVPETGRGSSRGADEGALPDPTGVASRMGRELFRTGRFLCLTGGIEDS